MKLYLLGESAFVELQTGPVATTMLCIGKKADVDGATPEQIMEMVAEALTWSRYREINSSRNRVLH